MALFVDLLTWLKTKCYMKGETDNLINVKADKSNGANQITDNNSSNYANIGSLSNGATQQSINNAINTKLGAISTGSSSSTSTLLNMTVVYEDTTTDTIPLLVATSTTVGE